jgi:basic membrane lipoprotein Med (substrate-binding protein (PBP1-ABC) superfamily)
MENANKSDDQDEISRVEKLAEMKKEQLTYGVDQVYDMFAPPMVFTLMTHAVHGAKVTRVILLKCQEAGLDLDKVFGVDKDMSLIDTNLDWKLYNPEDMTAFEKSLYDKLD